MALTADPRAPGSNDTTTLAPAQVLLVRARAVGPKPGPAAALELVRLADSDPSLLRHAVALGRHGSSRPDLATGGAVAALESALALVAGRDRADGRIRPA
jgi:hypothetical protein